MKRILTALTIAVMLVWSAPASAHTLWVNLTESFVHPPGHVTAILGFGHCLPLDDLLTGDAGVIRLKNYLLVDPQGQSVDLGLPSAKVDPKQDTDMGLSVQKGDLGLRKIALSGTPKPGTYQVAAQSQPTFFTMYLDKKGKQRMAPKPMDAVKDAGKVLASMKYISYSKAFFAIKQWSEPKPLGYDLEIIPLTDLSKVRQNELVRFRVTYKGKPLSISASDILSMTCDSNTFGGPDGFRLSCYIINGQAQFRIPTAGQWVANIYLHKRVPGNPELADLQGKCTDVYIAGSVGFTVKP